MTTQREIENMLKAEGWWIHRTGKHHIWTNGHRKMSVSISVSDRRALKNIRTLIRKEKAAREGKSDASPA